MKLIRSVIIAWIKTGGDIMYWAGLALIAVIIGAAIYAQWIRPEEEINDVINNQIFGAVPDWVWYVGLLAGLPIILLLVVSSFMTGPTMVVVMLVSWFASRIVWLYRRLFTSED